MGLLGENMGSVRACEGGLRSWFYPRPVWEDGGGLRGNEPLKKLFKGSHRLLKQLLQRVDPLPVSALSFNNNTISKETDRNKESFLIIFKRMNHKYESFHLSNV